MTSIFGVSRFAALARYLVGASACFGLLVTAARAQVYPDRPVWLVVPFAAGGPTDVVARLLSQRLAEKWKQPVIIDNKPGGGANLGAVQVARSKPDGYTLLMTTPALATAQTLYPAMKLDPLKDFVPISNVAQTAPILVVNPSVEASSVQQLVALAKKSPGSLAFASPGAGTPLHLTGEMFRLMADIDVLHLPYKGSSPALTDLLGGRVAYMFDSPITSLPFVRSGRLRALAVGSQTRSALAPEVPTLAEVGLPAFNALFWYALFAPSGTPQALVDKIALDVGTLVKQPDISSRLLALGAEPVGNTSQEFAVEFAKDIQRWSDVARTSGAKAE